MAIAEEISNQSTEVIKNSTIPTLAFAGRMLGIVSNTEFWDILQVDLQRKTAQISLNNLYLNYQNNFMLHEIAELQSITNSQLYEISNQLRELTDLIANQYEQTRIENEAKELIYNIKKFNEQLSTVSDKIFVAYKADLLLSGIRANNITSRSFSEISDKEYFDGLVISLSEKVEAISKDDDIDLKCFVSLYHYTEELLNESDQYNYIELKNNTYLNGKLEKPEYPKIMNIQKDIENEIESDSPDFAYGSGVTKYIKDYTELSKLFDDYFEQKKNYLTADLSYRCYSQISDLIESEKKVKEYIGKLNICKAAINKYLEIHPQLKEYFNKIDFDISLEQKDIGLIIEENKKELEQLNTELDEYYKKELGILGEKEEKIVNFKSKKVKKRLDKSLKYIVPVVAILIIVIVILIRL